VSVGSAATVAGASIVGDDVGAGVGVTTGGTVVGVAPASSSSLPVQADAESDRSATSTEYAIIRTIPSLLSRCS
jgi:hypothetical protein